MAGLFAAVFLVALTVVLSPSASVVTLAPPLGAVGIPLAGLAVPLEIDGIPDMCRSFVKITGHLVWAGGDELTRG
jgi:Na+/H+-dicarboxylate symporter